MLLGCAGRHQFTHHAKTTLTSHRKKSLEIFKGPIPGMNRPIVRDVVAVIAQGRREKRHQPDRIDSEFLHIIELLRESLKISNAIAVAVKECAYVDLVDDGVLIPAHFRVQRQRLFSPVMSAILKLGVLPMKQVLQFRRCGWMPVCWATIPN